MEEEKGVIGFMLLVVDKDSSDPEGTNISLLRIDKSSQTDLSQATKETSDYLQDLKAQNVSLISNRANDIQSEKQSSACIVTWSPLLAETRNRIILLPYEGKGRTRTILKMAFNWNLPSL